MKKLLISLALTAQAWVGAQAAVILQYHHVDESTPAITSVRPELFAEHMDYLAEAGFEVWPLPQLMEAVLENRSLPGRVVAITFDDGYKSVLTEALPVLQRHDYPFTVFVNPELVGSSADFLSWEELRSLQDQGATIANHTMSHPHLIRRDTGESEGQWAKRIEGEIAQAENQIVEHMGSSPGMLAYPYGEYNSQIEEMLEDLDLLGFAQHSGAFGPGVDPQAIPRFAFGGSYGDMPDFRTKVNTLPMPIVSASAYSNDGKYLADPLLPQGESRPTLRIELENPELGASLNCFASGQGALELERDSGRIVTRPGRALPVGRSRINCTAPSNQSGRFYWYSHFFIRKQADGSWYPEY